MLAFSDGRAPVDPTFDTELITGRIQEALKLNGRAQRLLVVSAVGILLVGVVAVVLGYQSADPLAVAVGIATQGLLYWPISEIRRLRLENNVLRVVPTLITTLPPADAAAEITRLLSFIIRGEGS
jgi:hypothetical protein